MKLLVIVGLMLVITMSSFAQYGKIEDIFDNIDSSAFDGHKHTIIYVFASWCGENVKDFNAFSDTLTSRRQSFNLIILGDTAGVAYSYVRNKKLLRNANRFISLKDHFPRLLSKKHEMIKLTNLFNSKFGSSVFRIGPSSLIILDKSLVHSVSIPIDKRLDMLYSYF